MKGEYFYVESQRLERGLVERVIHEFGANIQWTSHRVESDWSSLNEALNRYINLINATRTPASNARDERLEYRSQPYHISFLFHPFRDHTLRFSNAFDGLFPAVALYDRIVILPDGFKELVASFKATVPFVNTDVVRFVSFDDPGQLRSALAKAHTDTLEEVGEAYRNFMRYNPGADDGSVAAALEISEQTLAVVKLSTPLMGRHDRMLTSGRAAGEDAVAVGSTFISVTGSTGVNIASHSPGAAQGAVVTLNSEARRHLVNMADYLDLTSGQLALGEKDAAVVPELITELRAVAAEPSADRTRLARLLDTVRSLAVGAASIPLGAGLLALLEQAARALGV